MALPDSSVVIPATPYRRNSFKPWSSGGLQNPLHDPFDGELGAGLLYPGRGRGGAAGPRVSPARPGSATGLKGPRHH